MARKQTENLSTPMALRRPKSKLALQEPAGVSTIPPDEEWDVPPEMVEGEAGAQQRADAESKDEKIRRVTDIAGLCNGMVSAAVSAKESSGVESRMRDDLTFYYGGERVAYEIRGIVEQAQADKTKARENVEERGTRSSISVNITRPKVNAAFARLSDMLLPTDDRNFGIENTPVVQLANDQDPEAFQAAPGGKVMKAKDISAKKTEIAKAASALMQTEIDDNLTECDFNAEARKVLFQATCLGTGVLRGPIAAQRTEKAWVNAAGAEGEWTMKIVQNLVPESRFVDVFNFYPDPACNGNIKNARYVVERDEYNARMLRELRDQPGFITENIDQCLKTKPGPVRRTKSEAQIVDGSYQPGDQEMYEVYHITCELTKGQLDDLGVKGVGGWAKSTNAHGQDIKVAVPLAEEEREDAVGACVVMCNNFPIKAYLNPLRSGDLGYQVFCYEPVHGQMFGLGVSFLVRSPQRVLSTAWRMVMDNAAMTVGGLIVVDRTCIEPADETWDLYGGKVFYKTKGLTDGGKVEEAFKVFNMENNLDQLEKIIALALKFAEDETSLPSLMEGNQGAAPDTVGGMTMLMNSANVVLKVLAKRYDDCITRPHITGYYEWHMLYSKKQEIKGDFNVMARGSTHLVVRDLQRQSLIGFMQYATNPQLAIFFKTGGYQGLRKVAEANHITPDDVLVTEEEAPTVFQAYQQAMIAAAQARAMGRGAGMAQGRAQVEDMKIKGEAAAQQSEQAFMMQMKQMDHDIAMMKFATEKQMSLEQVKAAFAQQVMQQQHESTMQSNEIGVKAKMGSGI